LKFHNKPVIVLDPFNFYAPLHAFLEHLTQEKFIRTGQRDLIIWTDSIESALSACANAAD
jgi:predicted Rossmann-fold nucleotide-binding protein